MFQCPGCGGDLKFDIPSQQLGCEYCGGKYDPYAFESKKSDGIEGKGFEDDYEVTIFTCPQCGGEILSTDNAAAGFCSFCGASTILYSRISKEHRPNYIIPFKKTKEDCKQAYADLMKKAIFAPNELKDSKNIDSFRGIYMPYWAFYITQKGPLRLHGTKSHRSGDYIITDHYNLEGNIDAYYKGMSYDASSSFSDNISECLAPYDVKGMKAFTPAFLSGFYADTADVSSIVYQSEAEQTAFTESMEQVKKVPAFSGYTIDPAQSGNGSINSMNTRTEEVDQAMFPVWFMSYRNNDRVAYATVNGQTGKVVCDLPVDIKKYLLGSLILAVPLFVILNLFFTVVPSTLMLICAVLALVCALISTIEISAIVKKEAGFDDRGLLSVTDPQKLEQAKQKKVSSVKAKKASVGKGIVPIVVIVYAAAVIGFSFLSVLSDFLTANLFWIVLLAAGIVIAVIGFKNIEKVPKRRGMTGLILCLVVIGLGAIVKLFNPAYDAVYYGVSILSLLGVFFSLKEVIDEHNILSTRRLPQFNKEGGDDRA